MNATVVAGLCPECGEAVAPGELFCEGCGCTLAAGRDPGPPGAAATGPAATGAAATGPAAPAGLAAATGRAGAPGAAAAPPDPDAALTASPDLGVPVRDCPACGGAVADDGYCELCGTPAPKPRDHWLEQPAPWLAAMSDRGVRHARNEDAVALAASTRPGGFAALVVCDGVSSSSGSDVASLAAARAARDVLAVAGWQVSRVSPEADAEAEADADPGTEPGAEPGAEPDADPAADPGATQSVEVAGPGAGGGGRRGQALAAVIVDAGLAAHAQAVASAGDPPRPNPPSCTFVAAVVADGLLVAGWVGDSRAYWLPDGAAAVQLSVDDSWAAEQMALGATREEAESAPQAHAITRWLGVDAPDPAPRTAVAVLDAPGWVLLCSDGLWNYCSAAEQVRSVVDATITGAGDRPEAVAAGLVAWATGQGGHDNITVALARVGAATAPGE